MTSEVIHLPVKMGQVTRFTVNGTTFDIKKINRVEFSMGANDVIRRRYGNRDEILQDIAFARETGKLPGNSRPW